MIRIHQQGQTAAAAVVGLGPDATRQASPPHQALRGGCRHVDRRLECVAADWVRTCRRAGPALHVHDHLDAFHGAAMVVHHAPPIAHGDGDRGGCGCRRRTLGCRGKRLGLRVPLQARFVLGRVHRQGGRPGTTVPGLLVRVVQGPYTQQHEQEDATGEEGELLGSHDRAPNRRAYARAAAGAQRRHERENPAGPLASVVGVHPFPQAGEAAVQPALHRGHGTPHHFGDAARGEVLEVAQEDRRPKGLVECFEVSEQAAVLGHLHDQLLRGAHRLRTRDFVLALSAPGLRSAQPCGEMPRHAAQPRADARMRAPALLQGRHHRVLGDVLGLVGVPDEPGGQAQHRVALLEQRLDVDRVQ